MSTHFCPRPPTAPTSPIRPSTARSTIRAITPSPPDSLARAFGLGLASQGTPARPKSEGFPSNAEEPFARYVLTAENGAFPSSPAMAPVFGELRKGGRGGAGVRSGLQRGGVASGRSSPVRRRGSSRRPQRPKSTPMRLPSHQNLGLHAESSQAAPSGNAVDEVCEDVHGDEDVISESDDGLDFPDTPTPMTRKQKQQAYTPLGALSTTYERTQATNFKLGHRRSIPLDGAPPITSRTLSVGFHLPTAYSPHQLTENRAPYVYSLTPPTQLTRQIIVNTPTPAQESNRHVSVSGQSNISGGTATSHRSVFSTPGRDELERKQVFVERDVGPFGRAASMHELAAQRKEVNDGSARKKSLRKLMACSEKEGKEKVRAGFGCCAVM